MSGYPILAPGAIAVTGGLSSGAATFLAGSASTATKLETPREAVSLHQAPYAAANDNVAAGTGDEACDE